MMIIDWLKQLIEFFRLRINRVTVVLIFVGVSIFIVEIIDISSVNSLSDITKMGLKAKPDYFVAIMAVFLIFSGIYSHRVIRLEVNETPKFKKYWLYYVRDHENNISHCGRCVVVQEPERLLLKGFRIYMRISDAKGLRYKRVNIPWETVWAAYFPYDRTARFEYTIQIPDNSGRGLHEFRALCAVTQMGDENRFEGRYYPLSKLDGTGSPDGAIIFIATNNALDEPEPPKVE